MKDLATLPCLGRKGLWRFTARSRLSVDWIFGLVMGVSLCVLLGIAIACAPGSVRSNNERCMQTLADEQHVSVEAFFQNPSGEDVLAEAVAQCTR